MEEMKKAIKDQLERTLKKESTIDQLAEENEKLAREINEVRD